MSLAFAQAPLQAPGTVSAPIGGSGYYPVTQAQQLNFGNTQNITGANPINGGLVGTIDCATVIQKHNDLSKLIDEQVRSANLKEDDQAETQKQYLSAEEARQREIALAKFQTDLEQRIISIEEEFNEQKRSSETEIAQKKAAVTSDSKQRQQMFDQRELQQQAASAWSTSHHGQLAGLGVGNNNYSSEANTVANKEVEINNKLDQVLHAALENLDHIKLQRLEALHNLTDRQRGVCVQQIHYEFEVKRVQVAEALLNAKAQREVQVARQKAQIDQQVHQQLMCAGQQELAKKAQQLH